MKLKELRAYCLLRGAVLTVEGSGDVVHVDAPRGSMLRKEDGDTCFGAMWTNQGGYKGREAEADCTSWFRDVLGTFKVEPCAWPKCLRCQPAAPGGKEQA